MNRFGIFIIIGLVGCAVTTVEARQPSLPEAVSSHVRTASLLEKRVVRLRSEGDEITDLAVRIGTFMTNQQKPKVADKSHSG